MITLVEFIEARLAEDEETAEKAGAGDPWPHHRSADEWPVLWLGLFGDDPLPPAKGLHIERHSPARVLREVEAKRRLLVAHPIEYSKVSDFTDCATCVDVDTYDAYPCLTVRLLALPYAEHPDYRSEWSPS